MDSNWEFRFIGIKIVFLRSYSNGGIYETLVTVIEGPIVGPSTTLENYFTSPKLVYLEQEALRGTEGREVHGGATKARSGNIYQEHFRRFRVVYAPKATL